VRILLDTHVIVWAEQEPKKLGKIARGLLEDRKNEILISPISTLEISQLVDAGHLIIGDAVEGWIYKATKNLQAITAEITHEIMARTYLLPEDFHRDPADRVLVVSANICSAYFMTADRKILGSKYLKTISALK